MSIRQRVVLEVRCVGIVSGVGLLALAVGCRDASGDDASGDGVDAGVIVADAGPGDTVRISVDAGAPDAGVPCEVDDPIATFVRCNAAPLGPFDAHAPLDELASIGAAVAGRQVVMMGESDHGTAEAHAMRLRLIRYLYYEAGFTEYAVEVGRGGGLLLQRYLATGDEAHLTANDFAKSRNYANTEEYFDFMRELRAIIETRPSGLEPLRLHGLDIEVYPHENGRDEVLAYLDAAASDALEERLAPLVGCIAITETCKEQLAEALERIEEAEVELVAASDRAAFEVARDLLSGLATTIDVQLQWRAGESPDQQREDLMMARFDAVLDGARGGVLLYAHNFHIAQGFSRASPLLWRALGEHVVERVGDDQVFGIAMAYYEGEHLGRNGRSAEFIVEPVAPPPAGFFESYLHSAGVDRLFLDFAATTPGDPGSGFVHVALGTTNGGVPIGIRVIPASQWDAVVFVDRVTAPRPRL